MTKDPWTLDLPPIHELRSGGEEEELGVDGSGQRRGAALGQKVERDGMSQGDAMGHVHKRLGNLWRRSCGMGTSLVTPKTLCATPGYSHGSPGHQQTQIP